jgi:hypothetical protein
VAFTGKAETAKVFPVRVLTSTFIVLRSPRGEVWTALGGAVSVVVAISNVRAHGCNEAAAADW